MLNPLYLVSRSDLPLQHQVVQAMHAAMEHAYNYGVPKQGHPSLVHLTVPNAEELRSLLVSLQGKDLPVSSFIETFSNWGLTAIACHANSQQARDLFASLPLWKTPRSSS